MKTLIVLIAVVLLGGCMLCDYGSSGNTLVEVKWVEVDSGYFVKLRNLDTNERKILNLLPSSWSNFRTGSVITMEW